MTETDHSFLTWKGGGGKFHMQTFFYMRFLLQTIFFVSQSSCKRLFFLLTYNLFKCLKISNPRPRPPVKKKEWSVPKNQHSSNFFLIRFLQ